MPAELPGVPCTTHACSRCCYETEMPLAEADIARLEALGHRRDAFSALDDEGVPQLVVRDGHCVFLAGNGRCGVYEARPEGCRLYPLVWDRDTNRVTRDDFCPWNREFPVDGGKELALTELLKTIQREARERPINL